MLIHQLARGILSAKTRDGMALDFINMAVATLLKDGGTIVNAQDIKDFLFRRACPTDGLWPYASNHVYDLRPQSACTWVEWGHAGGIRMAGLCHWGTFDDRATAPEAVDMLRRMREAGAAYSIHTAFVVAKGREVRYIPCLMSVSLDACGNLIPNENGGHGLVRHRIDYPLDAAAETHVAEIASMLLFTLSLMNVKNVVRRLHYPTAKARAGRAKLGRPPQLPYHTLEVELSDASMGKSRRVPIHRAPGCLTDLRKQGQGVVWVSSTSGKSTWNGRTQKRFWTNDDD